MLSGIAERARKICIAQRLSVGQVIAVEIPSKQIYARHIELDP